MDLINNIFVYGTLKKEQLENVLPGLENSLKFVGKGYVKGQLFDLGEYPAALPTKSNDKKIYGQLAEIKPGKEIDVLQKLDEYEEFDPSNIKGSLFRREKIKVFTEQGKTTKAWIYWYNHEIDNIKEIQGGLYRKQKI